MRPPGDRDVHDRVRVRTDASDHAHDRVGSGRAFFGRADVVELASVGVGDHGDARFVETDSADQPVVAAKRMKTSLERVEQIVHDAVPGRAGEDHADFIGNEAPLPTKRPERFGDDLRRHADDRDEHFSKGRFLRLFCGDGHGASCGDCGGRHPVILLRQKGFSLFILYEKNYNTGTEILQKPHVCDFLLRSPAGLETEAPTDALTPPGGRLRTRRDRFATPSGEIGSRSGGRFRPFGGAVRSTMKTSSLDPSRTLPNVPVGSTSPCTKNAGRRTSLNPRTHRPRRPPSGDTPPQSLRFVVHSNNQ